MITTLNPANANSAVLQVKKEKASIDRAKWMLSVEISTHSKML